MNPDFRVVYLERAKRVWMSGNFTLDQAIGQVKRLKRQGRTAWVVDGDSRFVPIPGVKRQPGYLE